MSRLIIPLLMMSLVGPFTSAARSQEFSVYTRIYDERVEPAGRSERARSAPISRTTTVFHAGKVYDFLDAGDRITIYEPAQRRFLVLDGARQVRTEVSVDELTERISAREQSTWEYLERDGRDAPHAPLLEFQLKPDFKESVDASSMTLKLAGSQLEYEARCLAAESEEHLAAYLAYADWAARLNVVMHPHASLPAPRLALDVSLRRQGWLPVDVRMRSRQARGPHLRAEHRYDWKLTQTDRRLITRAENELGQPKLKEVDLDTFLRRTQTGFAQAKH